jgi:hypothetical protein
MKMSFYNYFNIFCTETNQFYIGTDVEYFDCGRTIETPGYFEKPGIFHMTEEQVIAKCKKLQEMTGKDHSYCLD